MKPVLILIATLALMTAITTEVLAEESNDVVCAQLENFDGAPAALGCEETEADFTNDIAATPDDRHKNTTVSFKKTGQQLEDGDSTGKAQKSDQ